MKQFLTDAPSGPDGAIVVRGRDFHYLRNVRRMTVGQELACRTRDGRSLLCRVASIAEDQLTLVAFGQTPEPESIAGGASPVRLHLVQGIPKGKKFEQVLRQATEIGASRITPLACRHSVADWDGRWENKRAHFEGVIREAFQQSGGAGLPQLDDPVDPETFCRDVPATGDRLVLFLHERELAQSTLHRYLDRRVGELVVIVGPEGGLAPAEVELFRAAGYAPLWLGPQVLRTETAAVVALGAASLVLRERDAWHPAPDVPNPTHQEPS